MQVFSLMQIYSRTHLKIELLRKQGVLYTKEAKDFFLENDIFYGEVYLLLLIGPTLNKTRVNLVKNVMKRNVSYQTFLG